MDGWTCAREVAQVEAGGRNLGHVAVGGGRGASQKYQGRASGKVTLMMMWFQESSKRNARWEPGQGEEKVDVAGTGEESWQGVALATLGFQASQVRRRQEVGKVLALPSQS